MVILANKIVAWLNDYCNKHKIQSLVVGVSGGIDSAVTSTLCCMTGLKTYAIGLPLHTKSEQRNLSFQHLQFLDKRFSCVETKEIDISKVFDIFKFEMKTQCDVEFCNDLAFANSKSRLRMLTLYQIAQSKNGIVVGTGNKIEDFGIGFFTKYGDGGVDISPIGGLLKSEVYRLGEYLKIPREIIQAPPTDGLWDDDRNDETQIGATYDELEWAMRVTEKEVVTERQKQVFDLYQTLHKRNLHKMTPIPVFYP